ncbi:MAG: lysophospholipid acyltransferase family protein [Bacteroidales bacterium]|jgi:KDO2-lipid IV(A) lauroyltransferase|nr:lysophospholipid acyltransferase family protein [Bacteroidales bacterium]
MNVKNLKFPNGTTVGECTKKIRRSVKYPVLVFLLCLLVAFVRFIPLRAAEYFFAFWAALAFALIRKERQRTITSLSSVYEKEKTPEEIFRMARKVFINQGLNMANYLYSIKWTTRRQFARIVDFVGEEHLSDAYAKGRGVICLMMHVGSWELSAIMPPVMGYSTTAVSKALRHPKINRMIVAAREARGMKNIARGNSYQKLLDALAQGECLIIMIDQDTRVKGVFVDFFGQKAYTPVGAARLALDTLAPVLPMYVMRGGKKRYQFTILPEIPLVNTGNTEHDLLENTKNYTQSIENIIREIPTQWVWMHERWKTTPEDVERYLKKKHGMSVIPLRQH